MTKNAAATISTFVSGPGAMEGKWLLGMQERCHASERSFAVGDHSMGQDDSSLDTSQLGSAPTPGRADPHRSLRPLGTTKGRASGPVTSHEGEELPIAPPPRSRPHRDRSSPGIRIALWGGLGARPPHLLGSSFLFTSPGDRCLFAPSGPLRRQFSKGISQQMDSRGGSIFPRVQPSWLFSRSRHGHLPTVDPEGRELEWPVTLLTQHVGPATNPPLTTGNRPVAGIDMPRIENLRPCRALREWGLTRSP